MKPYKKRLKTRLLTALGVFNDELVSNDHGEFDLEISNSCSKCLSDTELMAFFFLFRCADTYEEVRQKLNQCYDTSYPLNTVVKYGQRAIDRITINVHKDKRLAAWIRRHQKG